MTAPIKIAKPQIIANALFLHLFARTHINIVEQTKKNPS